MFWPRLATILCCFAVGCSGSSNRTAPAGPAPVAPYTETISGDPTRELELLRGNAGPYGCDVDDSVDGFRARCGDLRVSTKREQPQLLVIACEGDKDHCRELVARLRAPPPAVLPPPASTVATAKEYAPPAPPGAPQSTTPSADSVVAKYRGRFKNCYNKSPDPNKDGKGYAKYEFTVGTDAKVKSVKILCTPWSKELTECMRGVYVQMVEELGPAAGKHTFGGPC